MPKIPVTPTMVWTAQLAAILQVNPKTVSRWAKEGKLSFQRTLGGDRRYPLAENLVLCLQQNSIRVAVAVAACNYYGVPLTDLSREAAQAFYPLVRTARAQGVEPKIVAQLQPF